MAIEIREIDRAAPQKELFSTWYRTHIGDDEAVIRRFIWKINRTNNQDITVKGRPLGRGYTRLDWEEGVASLRFPGDKEELSLEPVSAFVFNARQPKTIVFGVVGLSPLSEGPVSENIAALINKIGGLPSRLDPNGENERNSEGLINLEGHNGLNVVAYTSQSGNPGGLLFKNHTFVDVPESLAIVAPRLWGIEFHGSPTQV